MPESAALVRSLCMAMEGWPRDVAKPKIFLDHPVGNLHEPRGLQYMVCPLLSPALRVPQKLPLVTLSGEFITLTCLPQSVGGTNVLNQNFIAAFADMLPPTRADDHACIVGGPAHRLH